MKRWGAALLCALLLTGCGYTPEEPAARQDGRLKIVAVNFPAYDFARQVAGNQAKIQMLLAPGEESHSYEPSPQDMIAVQEADLFIYGGGESDTWASEVLQAAENPDQRVIRMMDCVDTVEEVVQDGMQAREEEDGEAEYDEHVWTSPRNALEIAKVICLDLQQLDPKHQETYAANETAFADQLEKLDEAFRQTVAEGRRRMLVFGDRFPFRYLTDAYGLEYAAAFPGCAEDTEPSARTVAYLIDQVRERQIPVVLHVEFSNEQMADVICEDTGAAKRLLHSCHNVMKEQFDGGITYLDLMWENVQVLKEALG